MSSLRWLRGGNDRQLAKTYSGPSATQAAEAKARAKADAKASKARVARSRSATKAARAGQAWEETDRRRFSR
ncbi:hypothetical protein ACFPN0_15000 [Kitasatospora cinereorecta]